MIKAIACTKRLNGPAPDERFDPRYAKSHVKYGFIIATLCVLALVSLVVDAFARADIDYSITFSYLLNPQILWGVARTLQLTVICMSISILLGTILAVMGMSDNKLLHYFSAFYVWLFRGIPLMVQLLLWFNLALVIRNIGIPGVATVSTNSVMTPFVATLCGIIFSESAYVAEIVRGGILAVDDGQTEAAQTIGLTPIQMLTGIVLPQAMRVIIPPVGNEFISMLKYTSLAFVVGYTELLTSAFNIYSVNLHVIELLFTAAIWYLFITSVFSFLQSRLESRLSRSARSALSSGNRT